MGLLETVVIVCPYCGEQNTLLIDTSVPQQRYIEDCTVCCRPMTVSLQVDEVGKPRVSVSTEDEV